MAFILGKQFKELKEASKNGDERAKEILQAQLDDREFEQLLNDYYNPQPNNGMLEVEKQADQEEPEILETTEDTFDESSINTGNRRLDKFLKDNRIGTDNEEYQEYVDSFYEMFPNEEQIEDENNEDVEEPIEQGFDQIIEYLLSDENEAIDGYDKAIKAITNNETIEDTKKAGIIATFQHIKDEELEHIKELQEVKKSIIMKVDVE